MTAGDERRGEPMTLAVLGAGGRMGRMLVSVIQETPGATLGGATERSGSDAIGRDVSVLTGGPSLGVTVEEDPLEVFARVDGVIDFTTPAAVVAHAEIAAQARIVHVIGATGFSPADLAAIDAAARHATVVRAGNMSLGVNLLTVLIEKVARALDPRFDIEIVETHHNKKVDAPSGTALMFGEAAAKGRGVELDAVAERGRDGVTGARAPGAIGFASLRGGDVVGEHDVIFAGPAERVVLRHVATDRAIFARGAVKAALWARGRGPGAFEMIDVLGLR